MDAKKKNLTQKILLIIGIVYGVILFMVGIFTPSESNEKLDLMIIEELEIESVVQNSLLQEYTTTLTGIIKNVSNEDVEDLILKINVETSFLHNKGTLEYNITTLKSNAEHVIYYEFNTSQNYENILEIYATNENGEAFKLGNDSNPKAAKYTMIAMSLIILIICIVGLIIKMRKNPIKQTEDNDSLDDCSIEELENKLKKEKLKSQLKSFVKSTNCPYCGSANDIKNKKCTACGAYLK